MELTQEQKDEATARIEKVKQFMEANEVDIMAYPNFEFIGLSPRGTPAYGAVCVAKLMDTKYAVKPELEDLSEEGIASPYAE